MASSKSADRSLSCVRHLSADAPPWRAHIDRVPPQPRAHLEGHPLTGGHEMATRIGVAAPMMATPVGSGIRRASLGGQVSIGCARVPELMATPLGHG